jgi:hypothetical protein
MPQPEQPSLELTLLRNLAAAQTGDAEATSRVYETLKQLDPDEHADLFPTVRKLLTLENRDVQMSAAIFIGSLRNAAEPAIPDLVELAKADKSLRGACVSSLSQIPGEESAEALADLFVAGTETGYMEEFMLLSALRARAGDMVDHLPRIEAAAKRFKGESADAVSYFLNEIREARLVMPRWEPPDRAFGGRVELLTTGFADVDPAEHFGPHQVELPEGRGLLFKGRLPFQVSTAPGLQGPEGEVGLRVYRTNSVQPKHVVVISADDEWYGASPQKCIEHLATACVHIFGLDPKSTVWVEHWTASAGMNQSAADEQDVVGMQYDPKVRAFHSPTWRSVQSLPHFLKVHGITDASFPT